MDKNCVVCNNFAPLRLTKEGVDYNQCSSCGMLFSDPLDNSNIVGGDAEIERNEKENAIRIQRVLKFCDNNPSGINVLDFGCGSGLLIKDLRAAGFNAIGFDAYNPEFAVLPARNRYHICTMVEVLEHLVKPFAELDLINRSLVKGGICYLESSFTNVATQENIPLEEFHYVAPRWGHNTIHSHHSCDLIFSLKGFEPILHVDRHVRCYIKR